MLIEQQRVEVLIEYVEVLLHQHLVLFVLDEQNQHELQQILIHILGAVQTERVQ